MSPIDFRMKSDSAKPGLRIHHNYARLAGLARDSHARGRVLAGFDHRDIALARLYSHALRGHVIGAFYATRQILLNLPAGGGRAAQPIVRACESLESLALRAMDPVGEDARALLATFHHYATHLDRTVAALAAACTLENNPSLHQANARFVALMEAITMGNGLHLTRDTEAPPQGSFVVPNLGITIVPLVYGDHHSWNLAWLDPHRPEVPFHLHAEGVEIHLGYSPMRGYAVLGEAKAEVIEGYALPIPPETRHGYTNIGGLAHQLPFIFGSYTAGGWGVFLDVEPRPQPLEQLESVAATDGRLNGLVWLEREVAGMVKQPNGTRTVLVSAKRTLRGPQGGLELAALRIGKEGVEMRPPRFSALSVVRGRGRLELAGEKIELAPHDHFGIPAGLSARLVAMDDEALILLESTLHPCAVC